MDCWLEEYRAALPFSVSPPWPFPEHITRGCRAPAQNRPTPDTPAGPLPLPQGPLQRAGRDSTCFLSGDQLRARSRPPAGSEAAPGAQDPQLRVKGSGCHQAPPASPGAEEGRPPSAPRAPLRLPAASPAPPLLFPKSTPLTMTSLSAPGLLSTALLQRPPPPDQRPSIRRRRGPVFLDQTLTSLSCLQPL